MDVERTLDDDSLSLLSFCSDDVGSLPGPEEAERLLADLDEYDAAEAAATAAPQPAAPATPDAAPPNTDTRTERAEKLTDWVSVTAPMEEDTEEAEPNSSAHDLVTPTASLGRTMSRTADMQRDEATESTGEAVRSAIAGVETTRAEKRKGLFSPCMKAARKTAGRGAPTDVELSRFTKQLAAELHEPKLALLRRAVNLLGVTVASQLLADVQALEASGGQMTASGDRKRTPGGVFWNLLKAQATGDEWTYIFSEEKEKEKERNKRRQKERNLKDKSSLRPSLAARLGPKRPSQVHETALDTPPTPGAKWSAVV